MEKWQVQQINNNIAQLVEKTTCSAAFIEMFKNSKVFESSDLTVLNSPNLLPFQKCEKFYEILGERPGSFNVLITSLEATKQTEALKILLESGSIFRDYTAIYYDKSKILRAGCHSTGSKIYQGQFGGRHVAVKVMSTDVADTKIALQEVEMLKKLDGHENIIRYLTVAAKENCIDLVLELFQITLQDQLKLDSTNLNSVKILKECTRAVCYLHKMNIIHTDLSPASILLKENGQVKIADFGFAQVAPETGRITNYSDNVRNKDWMAPEILKHFVEEETDTHTIEWSKACDVFSLGCIFCFVLTKGSHPFGNPVLRQSNIYYDKCQLKNITLGSNWSELIRKMIAHVPSNRLTAQDIMIVSCLSAYLDSEKQESPDNGGSMEEASTQEMTSSLDAESGNVDSVTNTNSPPMPNEILVAAAGIKRTLSSESSTFPQEQGPTSGQMRKKQKIIPQTTVGEQATAIKVEKKTDRVDEHGNNSIFRAVLKGKKLKELKRIVEQGSNVGGKNAAGDSILHLAIHYKDTEVIKFLISAGADVNLKDDAGDLPMHKLKCAKHYFREKCMILCDNGADINAEDVNGNTILALAASVGKPKCDLEFIISKSGDWKRKNKKGQTAMHMAVLGGNPEVVKYLVTIGCKIDAKDSNGEMPVHWIRFTMKNFNETLDTLLSSGAFINATDKDGDTVLALAAWAGRSKENLEYIINKGAYREATNLNGHGILHWAAEGGNPEAIQFLIDLGADVNLKDAFEEVPLHQIAQTKNDFKGSLNVLLENGVDINEHNEFGHTLLSLAALHGRPKADLEYIVEKGGNWKVKNRKWESCLHFAAEGGNIEAIHYFISLGLPINSLDNKEQLALHNLVFNTENFEKTLDVLLEYGTSINAVDKYGDTLLSIVAWEGRSRQILECIINRGGNWKKRNENGRTLLHMAALGADMDVIKYVIALGLKVKGRDKNGNTPLHLLVYANKNFRQCVDLFLEHGAVINATNKERHTVLDLAVIEKMGEEDLEYIVSKGGVGKLYIDIIS